ncbi:alpha/beta fold hydrolase, partial [Rhizobium johnstonii]|uniref:alpha/beta fold hydrolase n=1 Tax=Rhizobium johnstonii TaxID=3019933 RepID=UPI003F9C407C
GRTGALRLLAAPLFRHPSRIDASVFDALSVEVRPRAFTGAARAARGYDPRLWHRIVAPVTAVAGESDVFLANDDIDRLAGLLVKMRSVVLPTTGHFAHIERPFAVLEAFRRD